MPAIGLLMAHVLFGVLGTLASVALLVYVLNLSSENLGKVKTLTLAVVAFFILSYLAGGFWYVAHYAPEKALILAGPWPWAHKYFMEVKEHVFFVLLLLTLYLPFITFDRQFLGNAALKKVAITMVAILVVLGLTMDGFGAIIAMGSKLATLAELTATGLGG